MKLCTIKEYHLGTKLGQVRSVPVRLGARPENAVLFVYSSQPNLDPWPELFDYPQDTLKMVLYTENGIPMWERDLGPGVIQVSGMRRLFPLTLMEMAWMKSGFSTT